LEENETLHFVRALGRRFPKC